MKSKGFALHWQILIAVMLAVFVGIIFPTKYKFTYDSYEKFSNNADFNQISPILVKNLQVFRDKEELSETNFLKEINNISEIPITGKKKQFILKSAKYNPVVSYISRIGELFLRVLKMIVIPLILTSIISGLSNIAGTANLGRLGLKTMIYYLATSTIAILIGLFLVDYFKPGIGIDTGLTETIDKFDVSRTTFSDILINIIPENIFKSLLNQDMLSIILLAMLFGYFITISENKTKVFMTNFFNSANEVIMKITMFIIKFTPLGIFGLITATVADLSGDVDKLTKTAQSLGLFVIVVLLGLAFHSIIILPLIVKIFGKANPYKHFKAMRAVLLTAFSTSSSAATLSLTMESVEHKCGVSTKISGFTLPLGATVNMDGTALYECVAAMFIAQAYGIDLTFPEQLIVVVTALLASIGAAGIPMAGLVMLSVVLTAVDLPLEGIGLIIVVDRILDMLRTSVNVWSDTCGAVIIAKSEGEILNV